jgi:hypothetical protein
MANVEASATDAELTGLDDADTAAHTNHYVCDRMRPFEADPDGVAGSAVRHERARELLAERSGGIDPATMRDMLSDHATSPSLCRHTTGDPTPTATKTVFWVVADMTDLRITFGRGNPCDSIAQDYTFAT